MWLESVNLAAVPRRKLPTYAPLLPTPASSRVLSRRPLRRAYSSRVERL